MGATAAARQTLLEKGSVLIRALESGSRVGMGLRMHHAQQQALLEKWPGSRCTLVCGHG
ncbi:hypothetical protein ACNKHN_23015 [Shigella flexneri]